MVGVLQERGRKDDGRLLRWGGGRRDGDRRRQLVRAVRGKRVVTVTPGFSCRAASIIWSIKWLMSHRFWSGRESVALAPLSDRQFSAKDAGLG